MRSIEAKGEWGGVNPFRTSSELDKQQKMIAVITRATASALGSSETMRSQLPKKKQ
jgi:hypothetical protein